MAKFSSKQQAVRLCVIIGTPILLLSGCLTADLMALKSAQPPASVKNIQDFEAWKGPAIKGRREYENSGTNYTVILGPAGRTIASGPSAYVFDSGGDFVDWTADMGDFKTRKYGFDLSGGRVKRENR